MVIEDMNERGLCLTGGLLGVQALGPPTPYHVRDKGLKKKTEFAKHKC